MTNHTAAEPPKFLARPGQTWLTAKGHRVLIVAGAGGAEAIEAHYVGGRVDGYGSVIFDLCGNARGIGSDRDRLVERIEQAAAADGR